MTGHGKHVAALPVGHGTEQNQAPMPKSFFEMTDDEQEAIKKNMTGNVKVTVKLPTPSAGNIYDTIATTNWEFLAAFSNKARDAVARQHQPTQLALSDITTPSARDVLSWMRSAAQAKGAAPLVMTGVLTQTTLLDRIRAAREVGIDLRYFDTNQAIVSLMRTVTFGNLIQLLEQTLVHEHKIVADKVLGALDEYCRTMSLSAAAALWRECEKKQLRRALETLYKALVQSLEADPELFHLANIGMMTRQIGYPTDFTRAAAKRHADRLLREHVTILDAIHCMELKGAWPNVRCQVKDWLYAELERRKRMASSGRGMLKIGKLHNG